MNSPSPITRRRFLQQTFAFSALALTGLQRSARGAIALDPSGSNLFMIGDWGREDDFTQQKAVMAAMRRYAAQHQFHPEALLLLGDNFYGELDGGVKSPRWHAQFEEMYAQADFPGPCYAILGNHDYDPTPVGKTEAQLAYGAANPGTRWTMPAKWYRFEYPKKDPLVTFLATDTNLAPSNSHEPKMAQREADAENAWLRAELAKPRTTPYLVVLGHHPVYSNGHHGDNAILIRDWDPLFRKHGVDLYLAGHDHDLQHLEFAGHPTSFVISGGGGAKLTKIYQRGAPRGPYSRSIAGFTHFQVSRAQLQIWHVDVTGAVLHSFAKSRDGKVTV